MAYLAAGSAGLKIVDVANPSQPHLVGSGGGPAGGAAGVWVEAGYAYLVGPYGFKGNEVILTVVDVSIPTRPLFVREYYEIPSMERYLRRVQVVGNYAIASGDYYDTRGHYYALWIVDISHPDAPIVATTRFEMPHGVTDTTIRGNKLYATILGGGLEILGLSSPPSPSLLVTHYPGIGPLIDVNAGGSYASVISSRFATLPFFGGKADGDLGVVDVADPYRPKVAARLQDPSANVRALVQSGPYVYHLDSQYKETGIEDQMNVADLSDPRHPVERGGWGSYELLVDLAASGSHVYVGQNRGQEFDSLADHSTDGHARGCRCQ